MSEPSASDQIQFLANLQRLLAEGNFTATYKYALLLALADLSVETVGEGEAVLVLDVQTLAEKFIEYYWRQTLPYTSEILPNGRVLFQSNDVKKEAAVLSVIQGVRQVCDGSIPIAKANKHLWGKVLRKIAKVICEQPLWRLQMIGKGEFSFLYENKWHQGKAGTIALRPGVAFNFRRFHQLIQSLVKDAWARHVRKLSANRTILGETSDLHEFLFGSDRQDLSRYVSILAKIQRDTCFYCGAPLKKKMEVDHFIPWSRYPVDLSHNFVLADAECNNDKRKYLPAIMHLQHWLTRNQEDKHALEKAFNEASLPFNLSASVHVARWAYEQAEISGASLWLSRSTLCPLDSSWRLIIP